MADKLTISDGTATVVTEEGRRIQRTESDLIEMIRRDIEAPLNGAALPDGVKFPPDWRDPIMIVVHQHTPHLRRLRWIAGDSPAPKGPNAKYKTVRISLPYVTTFAVFCYRAEQLHLVGNNEIYFSNQPLKSRNDRLCFPALLNVTIAQNAGRQRTGICTGPLPGINTGWVDGLDALLDRIWNGSFNLSCSQSSYTDSKGIHPDLHPIEKWEEASARDELFALSVAWKPCPMSVGEIVEAIFAEMMPRFVRHRQAVPTPSLSLERRFVNYAQRNRRAGG